MTILRTILSCVVGLFMTGCVCFSTPAYPEKDPQLSEMIKNTKIEYVRYKGALWDCIVPGKHVMMSKTLYLNKAMWEVESLVYKRGIIVHEAVHAVRQAQAGFLLWGTFYLISPKFRWEEEKVAYAAEWKFLLRNDIDFPMWKCENFAKMASDTYCGMVTCDEALVFIKETVARLKKELETESNQPK